MQPRTHATHVAVSRTVGVRLIPFLFVLYVVAYLDRINIGFAALTMNRELGLTSAQFGLLSGIFFCGYFLFELPSNLILSRMGAKRWIARILLSWGAVALATAFARTAGHLYVARFALGAAEAGFFPGVLLYLTYWFRSRDLPQAIGSFMTAIPVASVVGAPLSGWILDHVSAFGLSGWRWVLILEAIPAVVAGVVTLYWLPDGPANARFLSADERAHLDAELRAEADLKSGTRRSSLGRTLRDGRVLYLCLVAFLFLIGLYTASFWMPQSLAAASHGMSHTALGGLTLIPHALGLLSMVAVSRSSRRHGERHVHAALAVLVASAGFGLVGHAHDSAPCVAAWSIVTCGLYGFVGPFWAIPGQFLAGRAAAAALAFINSIGNLGGFFGVLVVGILANRTHDGSAGYGWVAISVLCAGVLLLLARKQRYALPAAAAAGQSA
ncbi:MAG: MFS transporter [Proteobacteria bacterium]|nr:MFS transporter [Pseudomonadota bacterium]